ncbi:hypothetical protein LEMLEM_LOCUS8813 [Lemmus lemmus]
MSAVRRFDILKASVLRSYSTPASHVPEMGASTKNSLLSAADSDPGFSMDSSFVHFPPPPTSVPPLTLRRISESRPCVIRV